MDDSIKDARERFLRCVPKHQLIIKRDNGVYRHLRFKEPGRFAYYFDLITWPGCLCIEGDCGSYTFKRLYDMFEFFRREPGDFMRDDGLSINPDYWAQKLEAQSCNGRSPGNVRRWSPERFEEAVKGDVIDHMRHNMRGVDRYELRGSGALSKARRALIEAVREEVLEHSGDEHTAMQAAHEFDFDEGDERFCFQDFYEHDCTEWDYQYLWNCFAIVWGIQRYDAIKRPWYIVSKEELKARSALARRAA